MASDDQKLKLVHLIRILEEETDDEHGLTGPQLIAALAERGVTVERKTLYRDLEALRSAGYDVQKYQRSPVEYGLATRAFEQPELLLLADAVQSSRFLTQRKEPVLQHGGDVYVETPVHLVYTGDCYYTVVWNDKHANFTNYRVDRMLELRVSEEAATRNDRIASFDAAAYQQSAFSMFGGRRATVTLRVRACAMSSVIDKFGRDVTSVPRGDGTCSVTATVMVSPVFYGWLAQFGGDVAIEKPASERAAFREYLEKIVASYGG
ncbi:MAG: helix-turn-helix transcriptional regulator [Coriobacteriales bacterium]